MRSVRLKAYALLLAVAIIWGIAGPVIKLTVKEIPPFSFLTYRFLISAIVAIPILYLTKFKLSKKFSVNVKVVAICVLNTTGALGLLFWGAERTSLLQMSLITVFGPILTILAGAMFLRDRITKQERLGILIAFFGSMAVIVEPFLKGEGLAGDFLGNLAVFGYVVLTTLSGVLIKEVLREGINPIGLTNLSFIVGFLTMIPVLYYSGEPFNIRPLYHAGVWYMAVISGTLAFSLLNIAQKSIELSEVAIFMYLYPTLSGILAILILGDKLTPIIAISAVATIIGVAIAEIKKKR